MLQPGRAGTANGRNPRKSRTNSRTSERIHSRQPLPSRSLTGMRPARGQALRANLLRVELQFAISVMRLNREPLQRPPARKQVARFLLCQEFQTFRRLDMHIVKARRFLEMGLDEIRHPLKSSACHAEGALSRHGVEIRLAC